MELKDRRFNPFRTAKSEALCVVISDLVKQIEKLEISTEARRRVRKAADQLTFERQIDALFCNAALLYLEHPGAWISISRSKENLSRSDRYSSSVLSKTLPGLLDRLGDTGLGILEIRDGFNSPFNGGKRMVTTFRLSAAATLIFAKLGLELASFGLHEEQEVIILKAVKDGVFDQGKYLQYEDTTETAQYRGDLRAINTWIEQADIEVNTEEGPWVPSDRRLRRFFSNGSFTDGGRLFGGFWMGMTKHQRREITLDDISMVTLDYSQMGPRILYGMAGVLLCPEDAYAVPGLEGCREGVKKLMAAMVHVAKPITRYPKGIRELFGSGIPATKAVGFILQHHNAIHHMFFKGVGIKAMFWESEILMEVLLRMKELRIVALPIHDAVAVREDMEDTARSVMLDAFKARTGIEGAIKTDD